MADVGKSLREMVPLMRELGVQTLCWDGVEVTLFPSAPAPAPKVPLAGAGQTPKSRESGCACGHAAWQHRGSVGCMEGCSLATCVPKVGK